jgi:primosomal protein N' (replication factor Y) (superfamily II helicase)
MDADVLVEYTNKAIDKTFTYIVPSIMQDKIKVGMQVSIPFNNKLIRGFVINLHDHINTEYELKEIKSIIAEEFILNKELLALGKILQEHTLCSLITAYQTMFPSGLKIKENSKNLNKYITYLKLKASLKDTDEYINNNSRSKAQITLLNELKKGMVLKKSVSSSIANKLIASNIIEEENVQEYRINHDSKGFPNKYSLTEEQENAINTVTLNNNHVYLLFGETGSGKTEVYINLIKKVIDNGKTALLLVPEIALTTQLIKEFYERFGRDVAIFHSGLSNGEKYDEYLKIYRGVVKIVVGTRSAIFTPLKDIGIIIIDEEQADTYHQEDNPRYNAIDMAKFRAQYHKCPLVLGSATPTLEAMARAKKGVYTIITMPKRINNQVLPKITIVDMAAEMKNRHQIFSTQLITAMQDRLLKHEQTIILLNRRGYATIVTCKNCGYTYKCPNCDITLTYHQSSNSLRCHYCGYTKMLDEKCPECHEAALSYLGIGTEKLEKNLQELLPMAKIVRMDVDTTNTKGSHKQIINDFHNHNYDILLGTQMISKGLDFPLVTLVGVINADSTLNMPDFRSGERTFELLYQVAGRSGRDKIPGEVIIQSYNPDNYYLKCVQTYNYEMFYQYEMHQRNILKYPPYYFLTLVYITSNNYELAGQEANKVLKYLKNNLLKETIILGPTPASIFRLKNIYRFQIIIKYRFDNYLSIALKEIDKMYANKKNVNVTFDLNPSHL